MNQDIHQLLGRHFSGEATPEEEEAIRIWRMEGPDREEEYRLLEKLWKASGEEPGAWFDTDAAWNEVRGRLKPRRALVRTLSFPVRVAMAAACVVLLVAAWWLLKGPSGLTTLVARVDGQEVVLSDGTHVFLKKDSRLRYPQPFRGDSRDVELEGAAFFDVAHDPSHPFRIRAEETRVQVLGTRFMLSTLNHQVELIVRSGRVRFRTENDPGLEVGAGERALYTNVFVKSLNTDPNFDSWKTGLLIFDQTPLAEVIGALNRQYGVRIRMKADDASQLSESRITTRFQGQSLESVLQELSAITSFRIRKLDANAYEISLN